MRVAQGWARGCKEEGMRVLEGAHGSSKEGIGVL